VSTPRVLIVHPALPPYRVDLFNSLAQRYTVRLVFLRRNLISQRFDQKALRRALAADVGYLTRGFTLRNRTVRYGVGREIAQFRPDVVVTSEFSPATLAAVAHRHLLGGRFGHLVWTDDNASSVLREIRLRSLLRRWVLPRVDGLLVLSEESAELYRTRYGAQVAIGVCPIQHDPAVFRERLREATTAAQRTAAAWNLVGKRVVLFVGRLAPEKRADILLRAFARMPEGATPVVLALVGDGPERAALEALARTLRIAERVVFAGRQEGPDLYAWYRLGAVFALTSEYEPYGAVVNEALEAGLPVVCTDRAGARILIRSGTNGAIVDGTDVTQVSAALEMWLARTEPFSDRSFDGMRPSRMQLRFEDSVAGFASAVDMAAAARQARR
jgi:glycosyltransferase involved in cell wall biosynthesis